MPGKGETPLRRIDRHGRFAYDGLDRVIHEKARLGILTSLSTHPAGLLFNDLKKLCALTDGNLSRHLTVLSDAGLVEIWKGIRRNRNPSMYRITAEGRERFQEYLTVLEKVVSDAAGVADAPARRAWEVRGELADGWSGA